MATITAAISAATERTKSMRLICAASFVSRQPIEVVAPLGRTMTLPYGGTSSQLPNEGYLSFRKGCLGRACSLGCPEIASSETRSGGGGRIWSGSGSCVPAQYDGERSGLGSASSEGVEREGWTSLDGR